MTFEPAPAQRKPYTPEGKSLRRAVQERHVISLEHQLGHPLDAERHQVEIICRKGVIRCGDCYLAVPRPGAEN